MHVVTMLLKSKPTSKNRSWNFFAIKIPWANKIDNDFVKLDSKSKLQFLPCYVKTLIVAVWTFVRKQIKERLRCFHKNAVITMLYQHPRY